MSEWAEVATIPLMDTTGRWVEGTAMIETDFDSYRLTWTDHVANDWTEEYPHLSLAMARVAVLAYIVCERWGGPMFSATTAEEFTVQARAFLATTVTGDVED